jgi:hypothetical protein
LCGCSGTFAGVLFRGHVKVRSRRLVVNALYVEKRFGARIVSVCFSPILSGVLSD